ncbi:hypothetical protein Pfo_025195 [Paulownia fortunei]|nr:hypothetical protein Pfo_025195 [Paulownia fortunei]
MMSRSTTRVARSVLGPVVPRYFSTAIASGGAASDAAALRAGLQCGAPTFFRGPAKGSEKVVVTWMRFPVLGSRNASTLALGEKHQKEEEKKVQGGSTEGAAASGGGNDNKEILSYWGVEPAKVTKQDGTEWRWNCFRPWETYKADLSIDLKKHHAPVTFLDKVAYWTVKALRFPTDIFFQKRYGCRAMMLETVAAVPGMVGGMLLHCKSLRQFEHSGGWIKALLEEAENERMHLMTFMEVSQPRWYERALVVTVQGIFFNAYFFTYLISPKMAHRIVGYLEEEAIHSYTEFLKELDKGTIENVPAPAIAVDYWRLPQTQLSAMSSW